MFNVAASSKGSRRRYNWCPSCDELWVVARMAASGVDRCPVCDGPVLPYIGRSPYDLGQPGMGDESEPRGPRHDPDGLAALRGPIG